MNVEDLVDPALRDAARLLTTPPPPVGVPEAEAILRDQYGLSGVAQNLIGERDQNFLVQLEDGSRRVLKFFNDMDDAATRDFQHGALVHLEAVGVLCCVPRLLRTASGANECTAKAAGLERGGILISFVPGVAAHLSPATRALRLDVGRAAAHLGMALRTFSHPTARRVLLWDHMHLDRLRPFAASIANARRRAWLERRVDRFVTDVRSKALRLPSHVIHNDLSGSNVFVHPTDPASVSGVIDFGDMVHGPRINEIAVAAGYFMPVGEDPLVALGDVLEGYETVCALEEREVVLLHDLAMARLAIRGLISQWRAELFPENRDYILRHSEAAWRLVDWFAEHDDEAGREAVVGRWERRKTSR